MATRKNASKQEAKASFNLFNENNSSSKKVSKKTQNKVKKSLKQIFTPKAIILSILVFALGASIGVGAFSIVCKNDCFLLLGKDEITLTLSEKYVDEGVKIIAFNKDISNEAVIDTNLLIDKNGNFYAEEIGTYYIKYGSENIKYGKVFKVEKVRLITFVESSEEDIDVDGQEGGNE